MNYGDLLFKAHENKCSDANKEVRCYKTTFSAPKKLTKSTVSSDNIKKFLAKREEEEKKKQLEAQQKKLELLALRSQDKKAQKRVQVMLKRTKSANKSVMEDAIDNVNTADTINGPNQCDEDDYGYVSQEASAFYNKLMNKYENMPPEPSIFSKKKKEVKDLAAAKDRVKIALQKEAEEAEQPHKRKRKTKVDPMNDFINDNDEYEDFESSDNKISNSEDGTEQKKRGSLIKEYREKDLKQKIKKPSTSSAPPPPDFNELLKIAKEKQHEPVKISNKQNEPKRLMTSKEKAEFEKEEERKRNRLKRERDRALGINTDNKSSKDSNTKSAQSSTSGGSTFKKIPKLSDRVAKDNKVEDGIGENEKQLTGNSKKITPQDVKKTNNETIPKYVPTKITNGGDPSKLKKLSNGMENRLNKINETNIKKNISQKPNTNNNVPQYVPKPKVSMKNVDDELSSIDKEIELLRKKKMLLALKAQENNTTPVPKYVPTAISKPPQQQQQQQHHPPQQQQQHPPQQQQQRLIKEVPSRLREEIRPIKKKPTFKKRVIDSESEYDSELDDFIDDGPEGEADYSKVISEIFGYDKSKYRDVEEDDECMESNFAQQMKEEFVSTKIGIMEDLEDIRKEQEEKRRLKAKKKMRRL